jgi:cysteine-rich repeat protein
MKISSITNAHGELYSGSAYTQYLCCDFAPTEGHTCSSSNVVLRLSAITNAHAEIASNTNYANRVCFGKLTCTTTSSTCPSGYPMPMLSLSATTNAHLGSFATYSTKICCNANLVSCGDGIITAPETCDDGDTTGGDGCFNLYY